MQHYQINTKSVAIFKLVYLQSIQDPSSALAQ